MIEILILTIICYLLGSIPFAYLVPKLFGFGDIRKIGSGNPGTTNVLRTGNKLLAIFVLVFDTLKGFIPLFYFKNYYSFENIILLQIQPEIIIYLICSFAIIGHIFPVWLKFKGGKGVATFIGYLFGANYFLALLFIFSWLTVAIISRYSSLSSIISLIIIPFISFYFFNIITINALIFIISFFIILKHYSNILRLLNKTENKIRF
tara:strand:+ start:1604 stop:2221 length:618 start_codon:yes stop_codon:yes gene_type:complete